MHKLEAIRLVKEELAKGPDVPEAIILAVMSFIGEAAETIGKENSVEESGSKVNPFKPPLLLEQW
jgi:hypothetical protein